MKHFTLEMKHFTSISVVSKVLMKNLFSLNEHSNFFFPWFLFSVVSERK